MMQASKVGHDSKDLKSIITSKLTTVIVRNLESAEDGYFETIP